MKNRFMRVNEVAEALEVSVPYAYKIIRKLNEELESEGYLTVKGRVNRDYFMNEFTAKEVKNSACIQERVKRNLVCHGKIC